MCNYIKAWECSFKMLKIRQQNVTQYVVQRKATNKRIKYGGWDTVYA